MTSSEQPYNSNTGSRGIGQRGLHLNNQGTKKLASNVSAKLHYV